MIKLLIVDDESIVRQGIRQAIAWEKFGVFVVGEADNAKDAIKQATRLHPDIILCDIKLPGDNGFIVINTLKETMPDIQFILISGYSDQEYMLNAIRYGVCDYLLKPLNMIEIRRAVLKVCRLIYNRKEEEQLILERNNFLIDNLDTLRTHFINKLLQEDITQEQLQKSISSFNLSLQGPYYMLLLAKGYAGNIYELIQDLAFTFRAYTPVVATLQKHNDLVVIILNLTELPALQQFDFISETFLANSECLDGIIAGSPLCHSPLELQGHLDALIDLIERRLWYPKGHFCFLNTEAFPPFPKELVQKIERRLIDSIKDGKSDKTIKQQFDELLSVISDSRPTLSLFQEEMRYLFQAVHGILGTENRDIIYNFSSVSEIQPQFARLCNFSSLSQNKYGNGLVGKALDYIGLHYYDDLSLEKVACELYISPSYLSRILKEKTNRGFQDWLHSFRIQKAKELLSASDDSIYKIADLCGYNSYKLLSEHFRKLTGLTATEYRSKYAGLNVSVN